MDTMTAAKHMENTGKLYNAAELAQELNVSARVASGYLCNIRLSNKYNTEDDGLPARRVRVLKITGHASSDLWKLALGIKRSAA